MNSVFPETNWGLDNDLAENKLKLGVEYLTQGYNEEAYQLFKSCNKGVFKLS